MPRVLNEKRRILRMKSWGIPISKRQIKEKKPLKGDKEGMVPDGGAEPGEGLNEGKVKKCRCLNQLTIF